ncbi:hypothetical protein [Amycolatopsis eburnea]|uniref:Uncharacterized protein n=1 Tax=Amycolatopsis eburnea TaxID=2267691 RepID=A0A427SXR7_9PSEU|nr:hypothetical protein [Amycolatopsis eburnea]RSD09350.1 hypothetical protein EIY87_40640 [Amycolatopsis eburnea]
MSSREGPARRKFGRIDPYCLMAVLPVLLVAGILGSLVNIMLGLGCAVFAGLILLFDSWANRPGPLPPEPEPERRPVRQAPARPPVREGRPPVRGPRPPAGRAPAPARAPVRRAGPPPAAR